MSLYEPSRRERQLLDVIYTRGSAAVEDVRAGIPHPPTYSAVRTTLNNLAAKGILERRKEGRRFLYVPTIPQGTARQSALKRLLAIYFDNSVEEAVSALFTLKGKKLSVAEIERLDQLVKMIKRGGDT
jgi:BlaI family transcriptional regulator, penicillinase repressor